MVVKPRFLLAVATALTLVATASLPLAAATKQADPKPLRAGSLLRVKDIAANGNTNKGAVVAVGWHETSQPGRLFLAFSTDGGEDYRRSNGKLRRYPIVGDPRRGVSLAICSRRVWAGSVYEDPNGNGSRVLLTSRTIGGGAAQQWVTPLDGRKVRDVSIACAGNKLLAVGWLEKKNNKKRGRLLLRSMDALGTRPDIELKYKLGPAEMKSGLDVAATPSAVVATFVRSGDLRLKRFEIAADDPSTIAQSATATVARNDIKGPRMAARGQRVVVAYSDAGKVKAKLSGDLGATFGGPQVLVRSGGKRNPSRVHSADVVGDRVVVEVDASKKGVMTPQRIQSTDAGETWGTRSFGHKGARVGALLKTKGQPPLLMESWHNNAPRGRADTLRARYELP